MYRQIEIKLFMASPDAISMTTQWDWGEKKTISITHDDDSIAFLCSKPSLLKIVIERIADILNQYREQLPDATTH